MSLRRLLCGLRGHDETLHVDPSRVYLRCESCGRTSAGWDVSPRPITIRWARVLRFQKRLAVSR